MIKLSDFTKDDQRMLRAARGFSAKKQDKLVYVYRHTELLSGNSWLCYTLAKWEVEEYTDNKQALFIFINGKEVSGK